MVKNLLLILLLTLPTVVVAFPMEAKPQPSMNWLLDWLEDTDTELIAFIEGGKRSSLEDFEEGGTDADYTYAKYNFKIAQNCNDWENVDRYEVRFLFHSFHMGLLKGGIQINLNPLQS